MLTPKIKTENTMKNEEKKTAPTDRDLALVLSYLGLTEDQFWEKCDRKVEEIKARRKR